MQQPLSTSYPISDFVEWNVSGQLVLAPKFQRRSVWSLKAKSYLMDTILRGMPMPPLYIRLTVDPNTRRTIREVVDGQQRLRSILDYIGNEYALLKLHNPEFGGMYYANLPEEVQRGFLTYKLAANLLENVSDSDVLGLFARLNTYTVKLNSQELRNAKWTGAFKQTVYSLGLQHYAFWRNNNILTDMKIARMAEAELVSQLVVSMLDGIRQTRTEDLEGFYSRYDDEFPQADRIASEFEAVISTIGNVLGDSLKSSPYRRTPLFYSLFCAVYDAKFGLPGSNRARIVFTPALERRVARRLERLGGIITSKDPPRDYLRFVDATKRATADAGKRQLRHEVFWDSVLAPAAGG